MLRYLNSKVSKGIYSKNIVSALSSRKTIFKELTDNEVLTFHDSHNKEINKNLIFINDIEAMIDIVTVARGISVEESSIVVSVDGGKGRLLVTLSILGSNPSCQSFKDSSAKRTIVLACVCGVPESHKNLKIIFEKLKLNEFSYPFKIVTDFKLINMINGLQSSSSTYPCAYGECKKPTKSTEWIIGNSRTIK